MYNETSSHFLIASKRSSSNQAFNVTYINAQRTNDLCLLLNISYYVFGYINPPTEIFLYTSTSFAH